MPNNGAHLLTFESADKSRKASDGYRSVPNVQSEAMGKLGTKVPSFIDEEKATDFNLRMQGMDS